jgi:L-lactate dehydrogenase
MPQAGIGRVAIIGAGSVGSTCAYALLLRRITSEILLVDIDTALLNAQVQDLADAAFLSNTKIFASSFADAGQCDIIVITAGAKQRDGETRINLIDRNYKILESVIGAMKPFRSDAVLLLVSNPVDVLTYFARRMSGLPNAQVIGSGTFLDSVRLRSMLAEQTQVRMNISIPRVALCPVSPRSRIIEANSCYMQVAETAVHAYVLGEHGDSQFVRSILLHFASTCNND